MAKECPRIDPTNPRTNSQGGIYVQLVLSLALGVSAFFGFCLLRPKWKSLYAARKRQSNAATTLPELPDTLLGWMPVLYKVTEEQVLASAGLDAYVFLAFFKMSIKLFGIMFVIACVILAPINMHFDWLPTPNNSTDPHVRPSAYYPSFDDDIWRTEMVLGGKTVSKDLPDRSYLWAYLIFTYFFTGLALYFLTSETKRIIKTRQDYLGSQFTITDRTIKLSGIPLELRSEDKIKNFLERLEIGKVESVTLCREWKVLDGMVEKRASLLRKLEEAWTIHLGRSKTKQILPSVGSHPNARNGNGNEREGLEEGDQLLGSSHITPYEQPRPTTRLWYGFLKLQNKKVDAIDYYEEQLRKLDQKILMARKRVYKATPLAFVTMDSIPACQMAVQALLDPSPMQLLAKIAPAPTDIVWQNTYLPRSSRMIRSWAITIFILILTIFWFIPVAALAGLLDLCTIRQVWPQLANLLESHAIIKDLVQTGLPTLVVSLLNIAVPFLYDYLANMQGMISQGDVELSVISKNFFFTFFNVFLVFTAFGTASKFWPVLQESFKDTTKIAYQLAGSVQELAVFYLNFILLQGVGLLPFRLLEFGSVSLYPINLIGAKTPRDYAELLQPPVFKYGFYLPSAILIYVLCIVYSILPAGYMVLGFGLIYFVLGYYTYKYQLLYAMDHPQHATGGAWPMICYRIMTGLIVFQLVMAGIIALKNAFTQGALVVPLIPFTIWYSFYYGRTYEPLMKFIALRSIRRGSNDDVNDVVGGLGAHQPHGRSRRESITLDEDREQGLRFVNPSLNVPLEKVWINDRSLDGSTDSDTNGDATSSGVERRERSAASSLSLGDTHIWREVVGDNNV